MKRRRRLRNDMIRDLVCDLRAARRRGETVYAFMIEGELRGLWAARHRPTARRIVAKELAGVLAAFSRARSLLPTGDPHE